MARKPAPARDVAQLRRNNEIWIDHARIVAADYAWLAKVERLTLWNVQVPLGFLASLEKLWWLDVRGGSGKDLEIARGVAAVRYLAVNQVRGMEDLSAIGEMLNLRYLSLYGLPRVTRLPSFAEHDKLERAELGQMKGLLSLAELLQAPRLRQLKMLKKINVNSDDVERIINHPSIQQFGWLAEDVPDKVWVPVVARIGLPNVPSEFPEDWFSRSESSEGDDRKE